MSYDLSIKDHTFMCKFQVVGLDSSVRPARVTVLSSHESKQDAIEA